VETVTVALLLGAASVVFTISLFSSGMLYTRPVVDRLVRQLEGEMARTREDCDYYRKAAQSCAVAVAHLEGQLKATVALLDSGEEETPGAAR
jgi:hypothetical protein